MRDLVPLPGPYGRAARRYRAAGWSPLPLPPGRKKPPPAGWTGRAAQRASAADVEAWCDEHAAGNVALWLHPGRIGIDVDAWKGPAAAEEWRNLIDKLGPLPENAPWCSSRDDGVSGIRLLAVPAGFEAVTDLGLAGEVIQHFHRYVVAPPSIHPDTGQPYRWVNLPEGRTPEAAYLPMLPAAWQNHLRAGGTTAPDSDLFQQPAPVSATGWTKPDVTGLVTGGIPDGNQDEQLRDLVFECVRQGMAGPAVRLVWETAVARTPLLRPDEPWTDADFQRHFRGAIRKTAPTPQAASHREAAAVAGASWEPADLTAALAGDQEATRPVLLTRDDGRQLLYAGKTHTISGESESLKTWLVLLACNEVINRSQDVLFIDYEDSAHGIVARLLALGCAPQDIQARFRYIQPREPYGAAGAAVLAAAVPRPALAVIDGITEAMAAHGLNPIDNADIAKFNSQLPRPLADTGASVSMIDHVTKSREGRGRFAIGGQHKLSAVDGAAYIVEMVKPFGHGMHGVSRIVIAKDRPGRVREHSPTGLAGMLHLESQLDGSVLGSIKPATPRNDADKPAVFRPTYLMERISRVVEAQPGLSTRSIYVAAKGNTEAKRLALELLIAEEYITVEKSGNSHSHKSARPFRDTQDSDS